MIKNMTGMNDPAFQSNKTLKHYINQKLNSYIEKKLSIIPKTKSLTKINDKSKFKINNYNKKLSYNQPLPESSKNINNNNSEYTSKIISSSNSFKKKSNINNKNRKNNSFMINKAISNSKSLNNQNNKNEDYSICLNINDNNSNIIPFNIINNTPINMRIKDNKTTPIHDLNKKKSIYNSTQLSLNKSLGLEIAKKKSFNNNNKINEKYDNIINQKLYKTKSPKNSVEKKTSSNKIKLLKDEINNIINNKNKNNTINKNIIKLNKSYFREETKITPIYNNKLINRKINYSMHNKIINIEDTNMNSVNKEKKVSQLKDKINNLLKHDDESFIASECPIPMPYVKRYSETSIRDCKTIKNNENINLDNILVNKDLKEPKEEKKVPLPISLSMRKDCFPINIKKEKKNFIYSKKLYNGNKKKL